MRFFVSWALTICLACFGTSQVLAQSSSSGEGTPSRGNDGGGGRPSAGGGVVADFTTLMNLIEQTITPDDWQNNGGSNTMIPYPNGVFVDPKGQLKRVEVVNVERSIEQRLRNASKEPAQGNRAWQNASDLRMVSLKKLDQALFEIAAGRSLMSADIIRLGGINQISYVLIDPKSEDIILAGPADPDRTGFFLEDLAVVSALVNQQTQPLGCSIEPKQDRLLATQKFLGQPDAGNMLSKSPKRFAEQLGATIGDYDVEIFGMNPRCGTAVALVAADEHMKQLGFGKVSLPINIKSYFDHLDAQNTVPNQSMIRWWFAFTEEHVTTNESRSLFSLPKNCVRVLSEQQFVTQTGRKPTGGSDPAADAFASELSQKMNQVRNYEQNYGRLCCVFETALALQLALDSSGMADLRPWFPNLCGLGKQDHWKGTEPKSVPGLVTTQALKKKKVNVAVISGGVTINPKSLAQSENIKVTSLLTGSAVPTSAKVPEGKAWWWD